MRIRGWFANALARCRRIRRKRLILGAVALLAGLWFSFGLQRFPDRSEAGVRVGAALRGPLSLFQDRSPGARIGGVLAQTKPHRLAAHRVRSQRHANARADARGGLAQQRVLTTVRTRPLELLGAPAGGGPFDPALIAGLGAPLSTPGFPIFTKASAFDVPQFWGGDGPVLAVGPQGSEVPFIPVPVAPGAVPEPATWLMMVFGFGFVGWMLRQRDSVGSPADQG